MALCQKATLHKRSWGDYSKYENIEQDKINETKNNEIVMFNESMLGTQNKRDVTERDKLVITVYHDFFIPPPFDKSLIVKRDDTETTTKQPIIKKTSTKSKSPKSSKRRKTRCINLPPRNGISLDSTKISQLKAQFMERYMKEKQIREERRQQMAKAEMEKSNNVGRDSKKMAMEAYFMEMRRATIRENLKARSAAQKFAQASQSQSQSTLHENKRSDSSDSDSSLITSSKQTSVSFRVLPIRNDKSASRGIFYKGKTERQRSRSLFQYASESSFLSHDHIFDSPKIVNAVSDWMYKSASVRGRADERKDVVSCANSTVRASIVQMQNFNLTPKTDKRASKETSSPLPVKRKTNEKNIMSECAGQNLKKCTSVLLTASSDSSDSLNVKDTVDKILSARRSKLSSSAAALETSKKKNVRPHKSNTTNVCGPSVDTVKDNTNSSALTTNGEVLGRTNNRSDSGEREMTSSESRLRIIQRTHPDRRGRNLIINDSSSAVTSSEISEGIFEMKDSSATENSTKTLSRKKSSVYKKSPVPVPNPEFFESGSTSYNVSSLASMSNNELNFYADTRRGMSKVHMGKKTLSAPPKIDNRNAVRSPAKSNRTAIPVRRRFSDITKDQKAKPEKVLPQTKSQPQMTSQKRELKVFISAPQIQFSKPKISTDAVKRASPAAPRTHTPLKFAPVVTKIKKSEIIRKITPASSTNTSFNVVNTKRAFKNVRPKKNKFNHEDFKASYEAAIDIQHDRIQSLKRALSLVNKANENEAKAPNKVQKRAKSVTPKPPSENTTQTSKTIKPKTSEVVVDKSKLLPSHLRNSKQTIATSMTSMLAKTSLKIDGAKTLSKSTSMDYSIVHLKPSTTANKLVTSQDVTKIDQAISVNTAASKDIQTEESKLALKQEPTQPPQTTNIPDSSKVVTETVKIAETPIKNATSELGAVKTSLTGLPASKVSSVPMSFGRVNDAKESKIPYSDPALKRDKSPTKVSSNRLQSSTTTDKPASSPNLTSAEKPRSTSEQTEVKLAEKVNQVEPTSKEEQQPSPKHPKPIWRPLKSKPQKPWTSKLGKSFDKLKSSPTRSDIKFIKNGPRSQSYGGMETSIFSDMDTAEIESTLHKRLYSQTSSAASLKSESRLDSHRESFQRFIEQTRGSASEINQHSVQKISDNIFRLRVEELNRLKKIGSSVDTPDIFVVRNTKFHNRLRPYQSEFQESRTPIDDEQSTVSGNEKDKTKVLNGMSKRRNTRRTTKSSPGNDGKRNELNFLADQLKPSNKYLKILFNLSNQTVFQAVDTQPSVTSQAQAPAPLSEMDNSSSVDPHVSAPQLSPFSLSKTFHPYTQKVKSAESTPIFEKTHPKGTALLKAEKLKSGEKLKPAEKTPKRQSSAEQKMVPLSEQTGNSEQELESPKSAKPKAKFIHKQTRYITSASSAAKYKNVKGKTKALWNVPSPKLLKMESASFIDINNPTPNELNPEVLVNRETVASSAISLSGSPVDARKPPDSILVKQPEEKSESSSQTDSKKNKTKFYLDPPSEAARRQKLAYLAYVTTGMRLKFPENEIQMIKYLASNESKIPADSQEVKKPKASHNRRKKNNLAYYEYNEKGHRKKHAKAKKVLRVVRSNPQPASLNRSEPSTSAACQRVKKTSMVSSFVTAKAPAVLKKALSFKSRSRKHRKPVTQVVMKHKTKAPPRRPLHAATPSNFRENLRILSVLNRYKNKGKPKVDMLNQASQLFDLKTELGTSPLHISPDHNKPSTSGEKDRAMSQLARSPARDNVSSNSSYDMQPCNRLPPAIKVSKKTIQKVLKKTVSSKKVVGKSKSGLASDLATLCDSLEMSPKPPKKKLVKGRRHKNKSQNAASDEKAARFRLTKTNVDRMVHVTSLLSSEKMVGSDTRSNACGKLYSISHVPGKVGMAVVAAPNVSLPADKNTREIKVLKVKLNSRTGVQNQLKNCKIEPVGNSSIKTTGNALHNKVKSTEKPLQKSSAFYQRVMSKVNKKETPTRRQHAAEFSQSAQLKRLTPGFQMTPDVQLKSKSESLLNGYLVKGYPKHIHPRSNTSSRTTSTPRKGRGVSPAHADHRASSLNSRREPVPRTSTPKLRPCQWFTPIKPAPITKEDPSSDCRSNLIARTDRRVRFLQSLNKK
ncbi:uncharacterized protein LOC131934266 [Physella acuta]|uniref:uncharacterized protein LOC131934266 n=1 Tax=Physella acuta TaxID=109671 RepID=UPI0027DC3EDD|nr:uncharacterized protein LOC131934266 [Physella acuta]